MVVEVVVVADVHAKKSERGEVSVVGIPILNVLVDI